MSEQGQTAHRWPSAWMAPAGGILLSTAILMIGATGAPAAEPAGALVIAGGGPLPETIRSRFLELAGGPKARILVIPTASARADQPEVLPTYNYFKALGVSVDLLHTRDRRRADEAAFAEQIRRSSGVWLTGGDQNRLVDTYHGTTVEKELHQLLGQGKVIGGTSAGAAVMSRLAILGGQQQATLGHGFGFLPGVIIDQHFQNRNRLNRLLGALAQNPRLLGLGIDEQTAIVVQGQQITVLGNANVRVCWNPFKPEQECVRVLKAGDQVDLLALVDDLIGEDLPLPRAD